MDGELPVKSLRTTFRLLEEIVERNGAGISELAAAVGRPKSTVHDHLATLDRLGYLVGTEEGYRLGSDFLRMGDLARRGSQLYQASSAELERLAEETGEHASLVVEEHGRAIIVATEVGAEAVPMTVYDGIRMGMHTAAPGKAILAFLPEERVAEILERRELNEMTENTITDRGALTEELSRIRERRYALDDEERLTGMRSVAVPVVDRRGRVRGALTVYGPTNRIDDGLFRETFPDLLLRSGNVVEVLMNYD